MTSLMLENQVQTRQTLWSHKWVMFIQDKKMNQKITLEAFIYARKNWGLVDLVRCGRVQMWPLLAKATLTEDETHKKIKHMLWKLKIYLILVKRIRKMASPKNNRFHQISRNYCMNTKFTKFYQMGLVYLKFTGLANIKSETASLWTTWDRVLKSFSGNAAENSLWRQFWCLQIKWFKGLNIFIPGYIYTEI